jgi:hypothetical protein
VDPLNTLLGGSANTERLFGANRYATAVAIADYAVTEAEHTWDRVGIATGEDYPDALAGGVLQGKVGSVMVLTTADKPAPRHRTALSTNADAIDTVTFFGGTGAVSTAVRNAEVLSSCSDHAVRGGCPRGRDRQGPRPRGWGRGRTVSACVRLMYTAAEADTVDIDHCLLVMARPVHEGVGCSPQNTPPGR